MFLPIFFRIKEQNSVGLIAKIFFAEWDGSFLSPNSLTNIFSALEFLKNSSRTFDVGVPPN